MAGLQDKLFVLNYKKGLERLRQRHIEAIVRERFTIVGELSHLSWHFHMRHIQNSVPVLNIELLLHGAVDPQTLNDLTIEEQGQSSPEL